MAKDIAAEAKALRDRAEKVAQDALALHKSLPLDEPVVRAWAQNVAARVTDLRSALAPIEGHFTAPAEPAQAEKQ